MANGSYPQMPPTVPNPQQPMQQMPQQQRGYPPYRGQQWGATLAAYRQPQGREGIRLGVPAVIVICVLAAAVVLLCMSFAFGVWDRRSGTPSAPVAPSGASSSVSGGTGAGSRAGTGSGSSSVSSYVMTENLTDTMRKTLVGIQDCKWEIEDQSGNWYAFAEDVTFTIF